jgi:hypothetical protein
MSARYRFNHASHACVRKGLFNSSVAEPHNFYASSAPGSGENFDAAPAQVPTLLYSKQKYF